MPVRATCPTRAPRHAWVEFARHATLPSRMECRLRCSPVHVSTVRPGSSSAQRDATLCGEISPLFNMVTCAAAEVGETVVAVLERHPRARRRRLRLLRLTRSFARKDQCR